MLTTLAEIVIAEGLISSEDLALAADEGESQGLPLVVPLVRDYGVGEVALVAALKRHIRIETLDPAKVEFDSDAIREMSRDDCRRLRAVPVSIGVFGVGPRLLRVAMADPTATVCIAELEHLSGCIVEPLLVTLSAVEEMTETAYKHFVTEVMKRTTLAQRRMASGKSAEKTDEARPKTKPFHRISDEASDQLRTQALLKLCIDKGLFSEAEYDEVLRDLMKKE